MLAGLFHSFTSISSSYGGHICARQCLQKNRAITISRTFSQLLAGSSRVHGPTNSIHSRLFHQSPPSLMTLNQSLRNKKPSKKIKTRSPALESCPQKKGVCLSVFVRKPKKPNSGERRCTRVKLSTGKTVDCYIPGEGHNLQEHSVVVVRGGRTQDLPGVR